MIIGKNENVSYYCAYIDNESEYSKEKIVKKINTFSKNDEVVILTDMFGGSVNNEMLDLLDDKRIHLITGVNLLLGISLILSDQEIPIETLIPDLIEEAKRGIIYCNTIKSSKTHKIDVDEF